jgi:arylsulfatase A-like enzyme
LNQEDIDFLVGLYREEIAFTDYHIGRLLAQLDSLELRNNTMIILTADHGEEFMEHNWIGHTRYLYDTLIHVPLIIRLPGYLTPHMVEDPVSLVDVVPTLMDLSTTGVEKKAWDGRSLVHLMTGRSDQSSEIEIYAEVSFLSPPRMQKTKIADQTDAFLTAILFKQWKLIHDLDHGQWLLFDRSNDPKEQINLYTGDHPVAKDMQERLVSWEEGKIEKWGRDFKGEENISTGDMERLRSLGYVH